MAHQNILQLDFPDCSNEGVFIIDDISIYDPLASGISGGTALAYCGNLQITPPGYQVPTVITVSPQFRLILNACQIGLLPVLKCATCCPNLPDGLYNVRYSVAPNDKVFVEYKILRIVEALNRYYGLLCDLGLPPCLPDAEQQRNIHNLDMIYNYLISAKVTVEKRHQFPEGLAQYEFAVKLMDKLSSEPTCS